MKLPIRNYLAEPLTISIEPHCDEYQVPVGGQATVTLQDGQPHSIDIHSNKWISIWNEGKDMAIVEIYNSYQH